MENPTPVSDIHSHFIIRTPLLVSFVATLVFAVGYFSLSGTTLPSPAAGANAKLQDYNSSPEKIVATPKCVTPPSGMVAWWPFDESVGTIAHDITSNQNNGYYVGNPTPVAGMVQRALYFDGTGNNYIRVPNSSTLNFGTGSFSVDMWVKPVTDQYPAANGTLLSKGSTRPNGDFQGYLTTLFGGNLRTQTLVKGDNPSWTLFNGWDPPGNPESVVVAGKWNHIAFTYTPNTNPGLLWYINGKNVYSSCCGYNGGGDTTFMGNGHAGSTTNAGDLYIGKLITQAFTHFTPIPGEFHGEIDEVEVFKRALSPNEILTLFNAGSAGKCKPR